jgi:hypothetical protein
MLLYPYMVKIDALVQNGLLKCSHVRIQHYKLYMQNVSLIDFLHSGISIARFQSGHVLIVTGICLGVIID